MDTEELALGEVDDEELGDAWNSTSARRSTMESTGEAVESQRGAKTTDEHIAAQLKAKKDEAARRKAAREAKKLEQEEEDEEEEDEEEEPEWDAEVFV